MAASEFTGAATLQDQVTLGGKVCGCQSSRCCRLLFWDFIPNTTYLRLHVPKVLALQLPVFEIMVSDPIDDADASAVSLEGLANNWQEVESIRDRVLKEKSLLAWPNPKMTGVINFNTLSMNAKVIEVLLQLWCPQLAEPKTVLIDQVRNEVGWGSKNSLKLGLKRYNPLDSRGRSIEKFCMTCIDLMGTHVSIFTICSNFLKGGKSSNKDLHSQRHRQSQLWRYFNPKFCDLFGSSARRFCS